MTREIVLTVLVTLIVGDVARSSRWLAASLARWAAARVYVADDERASRRPEEWDALVKESVPSDVSALCLGISFAFLAVACLAGRRVRTVMSRTWNAYARLTEVPMASHDPLSSPGEEFREVSLALLESALELRLCLAEIRDLSLEEAAGRRPVIQRLSADLQLRAARASLLDPSTLGGPAAKLATIAAHLSDQAFPLSSAATPGAYPLDLGMLDKSVDAFRRRALATARDLADRKVGPTSESARQADGGPLTPSGRSRATGARGGSA